jgi:hypothetical protein
MCVTEEKIHSSKYMQPKSVVWISLEDLVPIFYRSETQVRCAKCK